ncbi:MAG: helix-turn-helix transcriptional regulator [Spirochaetales bacterium]|uniref:Helix-turn-helix transcriptional regulator n=1 Tax=Candidatus Thalassospirochaeta sargassi TaxID=3119039 RepID=A0AAJ1IE49_9SPIO|nr:helix-turn-helix transcriptional regulator [Spirochaetales bacterium]
MYRYFELILAMGTAWAVSGILHFTRKENRNSPEAGFSVAVILVFLLNIFDNLLRPHLIPMSALQFIYPVTRLSYFLVGPVLFFYVRVLLNGNLKLKPEAFFHLIPFATWFIYVLIDPASLNPEIPFGSNTGIVIEHKVSPLFPFKFYWDLSINLSRLIYLLIIINILRRHKKQLPDMVSDINRRNTLSWLGTLVAVYTGLYLLNSLIYLIFPEDLLFTQVAAAVGRSLPAVLFVFLFSIFSENQNIVNYDDKNKPDKTESLSGQKYEKSGISDNESRDLYNALCSYLEQTKPYLDSELTLDMLAEQFGETRHRLSEVINRESGRRFFSFINNYRLREYRDAVKNDRYPDYTIIAVAFECGFRSSSAFYSYIKKELDMTPKQLVREINQT